MSRKSGKRSPARHLGCGCCLTGRADTRPGGQLDDRQVYARRPDTPGDSRLRGLCGVPGPRRRLGPSENVPQLRPRRLLRLLEEPPRDQALPCHRASRRSLPPTGRDMGLVLRGPTLDGAGSTSSPSVNERDSHGARRGVVRCVADRPPGVLRRGPTPAPQTATTGPAARSFLAAFTSRSWAVPQRSHVRARTPGGSAAASRRRTRVVTAHTSSRQLVTICG